MKDKRTKEKHSASQALVQEQVLHSAVDDGRQALYFRSEWPSCRPQLSSAGNVTYDETRSLTTEHRPRLSCITQE